MQRSEAFLLFGCVAAGGFLIAGALMDKQPAAPTDQIFSFASAIAKAEGSPSSWNNPGDLTLSFSYPTIGVGNSAGVLIFQSVTDGWNALYKQLQDIADGNSRHSVSDTLEAFGLSYSGGDPNWAINVGRFLNVDPSSTTLGDILGV